MVDAMQRKTTQRPARVPGHHPSPKRAKNVNFVLSEDELAAVTRLRNEINAATGIPVSLGGIAKAALLGYGKARIARQSIDKAIVHMDSALAWDDASVVRDTIVIARNSATHAKENLP